MHKTSLRELRGAFDALSIPRNRVVMVHSGLLKFGILEGGVKGAYDCLADTLGPEATIVMPAFSFEYGATREWHARTTPCQTGALCEYFRKHVATTRSLHPFHSVCAVGPLANDVTSGISPSSFGAQSAFQKLCDFDAINLSVGTEFVGGATYLHLAEENLRVPYRMMKAFPGQVFDNDEKLVDVTFEMYVRKIADTYEYDNVWDGCWDDLNRLGMFTNTFVKGAMISLSNINKTLHAFKGFLQENPYYCARKYMKQEAS